MGARKEEKWATTLLMVNSGKGKKKKERKDEWFLRRLTELVR